MGVFSRLFGRSEKRCETCSRRMQVIGFTGGAGGVVLSREELIGGDIGTAEQCLECERVYCDSCYPNRPRNTCVCGRGRQAVHQVGGYTYFGSLRLVKVRYVG